MTRTTGVLKRLGVAGVAVATIGTGLIAAVPTASFAGTADITRVTVTDDDGDNTVPAGTCNVFTISTFTGTAGTTANTTGGTVTVRLTEGTSSTTATNSAQFCDPTTGALTAGPTRTLTVSSTTGTVKVGVVDAFNTASSSETNTTTVTAFADNDNSGTVTGSEPFGQATQVVTPAPTANDAVINSVTPADETNVVGEPHTVTVTVDSATSGERAAGIAVSFRVDPASSGQPTGQTGNTVAAQSCGTTNSLGQVKCTYTGTAAGEDVITVFINQNNPGQTSTSNVDNTTFVAGNGGLDDAQGTGANEPFVTVTKLYTPVPTNRTITVTPDSISQPAGATNSQTFTILVDTATTSTGATTSGTVVRFTVSGGSDVTLSSTSCTTAANGATASASDSTCTVTVTENDPKGGTTITLTATVAGTSIRDTGDLVLFTPASFARFVSLSPTGVTTAPGGARTFTATVTDAEGKPVPGVTVTFSEEGAGFIRSSSTVTNVNGQATVEVSSGSAETGTQTITATISSSSTQCGATGTTAATPSGDSVTTTAGRCTATATNTFGQTTTPPNPSDTAIARITLNVTSGRITAGNAPFLFGIVTDASGNRLGNREVTILEKKYNTTSYTQLQTPNDVTTNANGEFRVRIQPERQTAYVARATNENGTSVQSDARGGTPGRAIIVQVHNRINIATPVGGTAVAGRALQVRGDLDPNYASVRIGVAALRNGRFTYLTQGITAGDGSFVINVRNLPQGTFALVVYTSARQGNLFGSASRSVTAS